jgi:exocyst complex component 1
VIIVAVRKSGRVRVHKSKENPNGTFSIGKTWNLDDLTAIESYTSPIANAQAREWAGDVGFLVQIGKPYYWQAQTDKEKRFFIASLIKIYGKYTGGKTPELTGFDQKELEQILGGTQRRPAQAQVPPPINVEDAPAAPRPPPPESIIGNETVRSLSPGYNGSVSGSANTVTPTPSLKSPAPFQASVAAPRRPQGSVNGGSSPAGSIDSGRGQNSGALRRLAGTNQSQDSVANSFSTRSDDGSLRPRSRNGVNGAAYPAPAPPPQEALPAAPLQVDDRPPERKRPPMDPSRPALADRDLVPAPLMSPSMRREPMVPPRSLSRASPRKDSAGIRSEAASLTDSKTSTAPATPGDATPTGPPSRSLNGTSTPEKPVMQPPPALPGANDSAGESPIDAEESRPGLGPMIKKKSRSDIRGALWKAANASNAFKPRPGGAGDRLRQLALKSNEGPDGITGVVPAPSREEPRPLSPLPKKEIAPLSLPERTSVPEVKLTVPGGSRPSSLQSAEVKRLALKSPEPESAPTPPPEPEPEPESVNRRSIVAGNDVKYLATLGVDPSILDTRAVEYTKMLDFFGWVPGEKMRNQNFDDIKIDIDRELNRAQAGGWLARFREGDVRVDAIRKGIDASMDECEELDNLLTLYSVELSVSTCPIQATGLQR